MRAAAQPKDSCRSRAMADHGIQCVDGLVADNAGQAEQRAPEHRRHDAVGRVLREALDGRTRNAGFIERGGIATDDPRDRRTRAPRCRRTAEDPRPPRHDHAASARRPTAMPGLPTSTIWVHPAEQDGLKRPTQRSRQRNHEERCCNARSAAKRRRIGRSIPAGVDRTDQPAEPGHGMADTREQPSRPPQQGIHRHRHRHRPRKAHAHLPFRSAPDAQDAGRAQAPERLISALSLAAIDG